jgi:hypothetical protein
VIAAALAALLTLAPGALEIAGDTDCPAPADVARRLSDLLPASASPAARVVVTRTPATLRLVLVDASARELAARELAANGSCDDLAAAAAVVVAAWRADLDPDLAPAVRLPAPPPAPPPPPQPAVSVRAEPPAAPPERPFAVALGLLASVSGDVVPGAALQATVGLHGRIGLDASLSDTTSHTAAVGALAGAASWTRPALALGPSFAFGAESVRGHVHVELVGGLLRVRGVDVPNPASDSSLQLGGAAGGRLEVVRGSASAVWLGVDVLGWPGDQRLIVKNLAGEGRLSSLEVVGSLGLAMGRFP